MTVTNNAPTILDIALDALAHGLAVVPPRQDGTKAPDGQWKGYQHRLPTEQEVRGWYAGGRTGIGIVTGAVSGHLEMLEFEGRAMKESLPDEFIGRADQAGLADLVGRVFTGYLESTPTGGLHLLYRVTGPVAGNTKLARRPATAAELAANPDDPIRVLIETRGEGGYVVVAPSHGTVHPSGSEWARLRGDFSTIPTITPAERDELHRIARSFDQMPTPTPPTPQAATATPTFDGARPGDDYNLAPDAPQRTLELLQRHGWVEVFRQPHVGHLDVHLRRPGKQIGTSAVLHLDDGTLVNFSTSVAGFEPEHGYRPFAVYAALEHRGDYTAAARQLRPERGYDAMTDFLAPGSAPRLAPPGVDPATGEVAANDPQGPLTGASWRRTPLDDIVAGIATGRLERPMPTVGRYTAGPEGALWYPGRVNGLYGEPGKGKTMIACAVAVQCLADGHAVAWIDLEEPAHGIVQRLLDLGAPGDAIVARFAHYAPEEPISHATELLAELEALRPALLVIDSTGEALALEGAKPNNDDEVAAWFQRWPRRLANRTGAAVVNIDHVVKDETTRGLWPGGSQRKKAAVNGSAFMVAPIRELGRGVDGLLKLTTSKDRHGNHRTGSKAAEFTLDAAGAWAIVGAEARPDGESWRPDLYLERVSRWLEIQTEPVTSNAIKTGLGGNHDARDRALEVLITEGYVERTKVGQRHLHHSVQPFRRDPSLTENEPEDD